MANLIEQFSFRVLGYALLVSVILFMVGAWSAAYFRTWPLPTDPLEKLDLIANDRAGWTAQAILFPVAYLVTAVLCGLISAKLTEWRWLAAAGTLFFFIGFLCWLPISLDRLQLGANAAEMIRTYDPATPPPIMVNFSWVFWANTLSILAALALLGAALALNQVLPTVGWVVMGTAVAGAIVSLFIMRDWPPFMSYIIVLILAIGLMAE